MKAQAIDEAAELLARRGWIVRALPACPTAESRRTRPRPTPSRTPCTPGLWRPGAAPSVGYKIGCTTAVMQRFLGIDNPCAGGVLRRACSARGAFRHADFLRVGVECEIAVALARDLPASAAPHDRHKVGEAVGACMAAIEIVDDRYENYRALDPLTLVADDFFHAGCVLGEPGRTGASSICRQSAAMTINGAEVGSGQGRDVLGHPLAALAWLANLRAARKPLRAGAFVLLGSVVETRWLEPGDRVEIAIEGLGTARARFA